MIYDCTFDPALREMSLVLTFSSIINLHLYVWRENYSKVDNKGVEAGVVDW